MTAAEELRTAAAQIRVKHGPGCSDHELWAAIADAMDHVGFATALDEDLLHRIGYDDVHRAARAFLKPTQAGTEVTP